MFNNFVLRFVLLTIGLALLIARMSADKVMTKCKFYIC